MMGQNGKLPEAKNALAKEAYDVLETIQSVLAPGVNSHQFFASLVMEANDLRMMLDPAELEDRRTRNTFIRAAINAATVGLNFGQQLGHAYLVPYSIKGEYKAINFIPGYRGLLELSFANGFLMQCDPELVLRDENCLRWHDEEKPRLKHDIPCPRGQVADRDTIVAAYCTFKTSAGGTGVSFIERNEINAVDTGRHAWKTHYSAMCLKTAIRRAAKLWRVTRQLSNAIMLDEQAEMGGEQGALVDFQDNDPARVDLDAIAESG